MRTTSKLVILAAAALFWLSPTVASERSDLEAKGLKPASGEEIRAFKIGKTCTATGYDEAGKEQSVSTNVYRADGTVTKEQGGNSRERRWRMDGASFCETLFSNDKEWCGAHEVFQKLDDRMYGFRKDGRVQFIEVCQ